MILVSILYYTWPLYWPLNSQIGQFERMNFGENYCDYLEDSWVITYELKSLGNIPVWIEKKYFTLHDEKTQVYDVTYVDYKGDILREEYLSRRNPIIIPDGETSLVQFTVPGAIYGDTPQILIQTSGGMDYIKGIQLSRTPIDLNTLAEMISKAYLFNFKMEYMPRWMPLYILLCLWFGIFLDGYLIPRAGMFINSIIEIFQKYMKKRYAIPHLRYSFTNVGV